MIKIIIGRESSSNRLLLISDNKPKTIGAKGSVPKSVSREHCVLTVDENSGKMTLTNQNANNVTFVNGMQIVTCNVSYNDVIELGSEHYMLQWSPIREIVEEYKKDMPQEVDISGLEKVWNDYKRKSDRLQTEEKLANVLRGGIPILTLGAVAAGFLISKDGARVMSMGMKLTYSVALAFMILLFIKGIVDIQRMPKKKKKLEQEMLEKYRCPKCNFFFGLGQSYDIIKSNLDACPKCKSKFKK